MLRGEKRQATNFATYLINDSYLENINSKLDNKKPTNPIRKWARDMKRHFTKEYTDGKKIKNKNKSPEKKMPLGQFKLKPQ